MSTRPERLRRWFAYSALFFLLIVAGFFLYGRRRVRDPRTGVSESLGLNIQKDSRGFTISKSQGGRTIFTISASKAIEYKGTGRALLQEVNIIVYGKNSNRFDQIYGTDFEYDPASGDVKANGEVHIDLESDAGGILRPDQMPPQELKNPIHLRTTGLIFNRNTGIAQTDQPMDFRTPHGTGSAVGVYFDSKADLLTFRSQVKFTTLGESPVSFTADRGIFNKQTRQIDLKNVNSDEGERKSHAGHAVITLREDNSVDRGFFSEGVSSITKDTQTLRAAEAQVQAGINNHLQTAILKGDIEFGQSEGPSKAPLRGTADRMTIRFGPLNHPEQAKAVGRVHLSQKPLNASHNDQSTEVFADGIDFKIKDGNLLDRAITSGAARIELTSTAGTDLLGNTSGKTAATSTKSPAKTTVTAGIFDARFDDQNRLRLLHGMPDAKIVSSSLSHADRITTSRDLVAAFVDGGISAIDQSGNFHYQEAQRTASADSAHYTASDEMLVLNGSPRFSDATTSSTAHIIMMNRATGEAQLQGDVKSTYSELKPQPNGGMLASSDPIHVTASNMSATRSGFAHYFGGSRLSQGSNIVQAPVIDFDKDTRSLFAYSGQRSGASGAVSCLFVQTDKNGKTTPVQITSSKLTYKDLERKAHFDGDVLLKSAEGTVRSDRADVLLTSRQPETPEKPKTPKMPPSPASQPETSKAAAGQVDRIIAEGSVLLQQPGRTGKGDRLVYTADEEKFVLTGSPASPPSIFDAERGNSTGDSLIFFSRDDRVLIGSSGASRTVTHTRVKPKK